VTRYEDGVEKGAPVEEMSLSSFSFWSLSVFGVFILPFARRKLFSHSPYRKNLVRPPRIELGLRVPETLVISFSLRARGDFFYHPSGSQSTRAAATELKTCTISS
jgi:hypothetical protein